MADIRRTAVEAKTEAHLRLPVEPAWHKLVSASFGAVVTSLVTSPLDVVKTRLQSAAVPLKMTAALSFGGKSAESLGSRACDVCGAAGGSASGTGAGFADAVPQRGVQSTSAFRTLVNVVRREGLITLWSGLKPSLLMAVPSTTLYFVAYEELKGRIEAHARRSGGGSSSSGIIYDGQHNKQDNISFSNGSHVGAGLAGQGFGAIPLGAAPLVAGVAGRVITVSVVSPLELLRTREMYRRSHMPLFSALAAEVRANGGRVTSLWRGFAATLWRDVPFSGIYWLSYEGCKARLRDWRLQSLAASAAAGSGRNGAHSTGSSLRLPAPSSAGAAASAFVSAPIPAQLGFFDTFAIAFASGVLSGGLAALLTTPFDVVKTRRQVEASRGPGAGTAAAQVASAGEHVAKAAARPAAAAVAEHGTLGSLSCIARTEGLRGLFAGVTARVAKVAPSCAIMIASYELGKRFLGTVADGAQQEPTQDTAVEPAPWAPTSRHGIVRSSAEGLLRVEGSDRWRDGGINLVEAEEETPPA